jgi:hypothetical protein
LLACRWGTALNSRERRNINYAILQGPLVGKAVAIVDSQGERDTQQHLEDAYALRLIPVPQRLQCRETRLNLDPPIYYLTLRLCRPQWFAKGRTSRAQAAGVRLYSHMPRSGPNGRTQSTAAHQAAVWRPHHTLPLHMPPAPLPPRLAPLAGACPTRSPAITSSAAASQLFVFHANAIDTIRKTTMTNWCADAVSN